LSLGVDDLFCSMSSSSPSSPWWIFRRLFSLGCFVVGWLILKTA
jgi:hypothetical protein